MEGETEVCRAPAGVEWKEKQKCAGFQQGLNGRRNRSVQGSSRG
jgi:hypothetical protein